MSVLIKLGSLKIQFDATDGKKTDYLDLIRPQGVYVNFLVVTVLYALVVVGGIILLVIPGIYFAISYMFAALLVVDKKMSIADAFEKSKAMTKGKEFKILPYVIISAVLSFIASTPDFGNLLTRIIAFVLIVVQVLAVIHLYRKLYTDLVDNVEPETLELGLEIDADDEKKTDSEK